MVHSMHFFLSHLNQVNKWYLCLVGRNNTLLEKSIRAIHVSNANMFFYMMYMTMSVEHDLSREPMALWVTSHMVLEPGVGVDKQN